MILNYKVRYNIVSNYIVLHDSISYFVSYMIQYHTNQCQKLQYHNLQPGFILYHTSYNISYHDLKS